VYADASRSVTDVEHLSRSELNVRAKELFLNDIIAQINKDPRNRPSIQPKVFGVPRL
jgi:hypothetical protein